MMLFQAGAVCQVLAIDMHHHSIIRDPNPLLLQQWYLLMKDVIYGFMRGQKYSHICISQQLQRLLHDLIGFT